MNSSSRSASLFITWIQLIAVLGCFSCDIGSGYIDSEKTITLAGIDRLYSETDSDLVISIPASLAIDQEEIATIYNSASEVPHCRNTARDPVSIMLAEACILYNSFYLFPEYLPDSLDSISGVEDYVGFMNQSDPFSFYYSAEDFSEYKSFREGDSAHIGFRYRSDGDVISEQTPFLIEEVYPFTRAWIDGLKAGDTVISINGSAISGLPLSDVIRLFPDQEGSTVEISVQRNSQEVQVSTSAEENIALFLEPGTAYLSVRSFSLNTGSEVKHDFQNLQETTPAPIEKIILDLRDNPGGSVAGALQLTDYLIDQDSPSGTHPILIMDGTYYQNSARYLGDYDTENIGSFSDASFVVLVDDSTASASEITVAALKYYNEATIMGMQTYGKGVSQFVFELVDGSGIWITAHYIYTPGMESFHQTGITPDYVITDRPVSFSQDPLLEKALFFLQTGGVAEAGSTKEKLGRHGFTKHDIETYEERLKNRKKFWK
jgi:carboxyl-terminal processing protease